MRFLLTLVMIALSSPLISAAGGIGEPCCDNNQCSTQVTCNNGLSCCYQRPGWMESVGGLCYDPKTTTCATCPVYNPNHPETQICPNDAPTCCGGCITSSQQCCHHYLSYSFFTCGADQTCCGFDNGKPTCCNQGQSCVNDVCVSGATPSSSPSSSSSTCPQGTSTCGTSCYQPSEYVCADPSHSILCPTADPSLCGDACYNEAQYSCVNGALQPVTSGGNPTNAPTTRSTSAPTSSTPAPGCVMPGDLRCGTRCYSPITHVCADAGSSFLCPVDFPLLCGDACYSSTQYKCVNGKLQGL